MKKIIFIIMLLSFCITSNTFAEENKIENASDTQKITQNTTETDVVHNDIKDIKESREEFKKLVAAYHKNPTEENLTALRNQITSNYDKSIERKKAKIVELNNKIEKLKKDIEEMTKDRESNINKKLNKCTETKDKKSRKDKKDRKGKKDKKDKKDRKDRKDKKEKNDKKEKDQNVKNDKKEQEQSVKKESKETKDTKEVSNEKDKDEVKKDK